MELDIDSESSDEVVELERVDPATNFRSMMREGRDWLLGSVAYQVKELASLLTSPANKRGGNDTALSKAEIKRRIGALCNFQS